MKLKFKKLNAHAITPTYGSDGAGCFDLYACLPDPHQSVWPTVGGAPLKVRTGIAVEVPPGHVMLMFSRSGHGVNYAIRLANCVGVIDSDYRGEIIIALMRDSYTSSGDISVRHGDRIAQAIILPYPRVELEEVIDLSETGRGVGGFGSTGR